MAQTVYDVVGGETYFIELVNKFYDRVSDDAVLMAIYPEDLSEPRRTTAGFLAQYWGGPPHYSEERGHPRLRMRHAPFVIGQRERDHWLEHMLASVDETLAAAQTPPEVKDAMVAYFTQASTAMINSWDGAE